MHMTHHWRRLAVAAVSATALAAAIPAQAALAAAAPSALYTTPAVEAFSPQECVVAAPNVDQCYLYSYNWVGYFAVLNTPAQGAEADPFTSVQATFTVPAVNCANRSANYVSHWVGLGGEVGDSSLQAAGVTAQCAGKKASYHSFWETYPKAQTDNALAVKAGDSVTARVWIGTAGADAGKYNFELADLTSHRTFSVWEKCAATSCADATAEVMSSAPLGTATMAEGNVLPLANYGTSRFKDITIKDQTGQSGSFTSGFWQRIFQGSQIGEASGVFVAVPGALAKGGQGFTATWKGTN
jgi:hypothetical protein